ncbi:MAG: hypothetical protein KDD51_00140 [Bdellovibrionales bacterium]|nr:hypothetical protein [Bdellovibrionales bacterium]
MGEKADNRLPELREVVKEQDRRVYNFCEYMLYEPALVAPLVIKVFAEFGRVYRRLESQTAPMSDDELRIRLFQVAWTFIQRHLAAQEHNLHLGRDTRDLKNFGRDLLTGANADEAQVREQIFQRILSLDADLRAPVVLRDILKFNDEQTMQILGMRWGVYRHRLNRGRLDFANYLRGRLVSNSDSEATV